MHGRKRSHRRRAWLAVAAGAVVGLTWSTGDASSGGKPLTLVALGDSMPAGYKFSCNSCDPFPVVFGRMMSRSLGVPVTVAIRASPANPDSTTLLRRVRTKEEIRKPLATADAVTITIGHGDTPWNRNDDACDGAASDTRDFKTLDWSKYTVACSKPLAAKLKANITALIAEIRSLRGGKPTLIRVTNFHNDWMQYKPAPASWEPTKPIVEMFNKAICGAAAEQHVPCIDIYHAFNGKDGTQSNGRFTARDFFQPNQKGHDLIARLLVKAGYSPLQR